VGMTHLTWFPRDPAKWEKLTESLSFAEAGALDFVVGRAWRDELSPCTIADSPATMRRLLGPEWRRLERVVRLHFTPCTETPGRLRCEWLWALHHEQLERYEKAAIAGRRGGLRTQATRRPKRAAVDTAATVSSVASSRASSVASSTASSQASSGCVIPGPRCQRSAHNCQRRGPPGLATARRDQWSVSPAHWRWRSGRGSWSGLREQTRSPRIEAERSIQWRWQ